MLHSFALCDGEQFAMTIFEEIKKTDLPLSLEGFANRNKHELSHEDTLRWIRSRICPPWTS